MIFLFLFPLALFEQRMPDIFAFQEVAAGIQTEHERRQYRQ
jgi:hypothetical protein